MKRRANHWEATSASLQSDIDKAFNECLSILDVDKNKLSNYSAMASAKAIIDDVMIYRERVLKILHGERVQTRANDIKKEVMLARENSYLMVWINDYCEVWHSDISHFIDLGAGRTKAERVRPEDFEELKAVKNKGYTTNISVLHRAYDKKKREKHSSTSFGRELAKLGYKRMYYGGDVYGIRLKKSQRAKA